MIRSMEELRKKLVASRGSLNRDRLDWLMDHDPEGTLDETQLWDLRPRAVLFMGYPDGVPPVHWAELLRQDEHRYRAWGLLKHQKCWDPDIPPHWLHPEDRWIDFCRGRRGTKQVNWLRLYREWHLSLEKLRMMGIDGPMSPAPSRDELRAMPVVWQGLDHTKTLVHAITRGLLRGIVAPEVSPLWHRHRLFLEAGPAIEDRTCLAQLILMDHLVHQVNGSCTMGVVRSEGPRYPRLELPPFTVLPPVMEDLEFLRPSARGGGLFPYNRSPLFLHHVYPGFQRRLKSDSGDYGAYFRLRREVAKEYLVLHPGDPDAPRLILLTGFMGFWCSKDHDPRHEPVFDMLEPLLEDDRGELVAVLTDRQADALCGGNPSMSNWLQQPPGSPGYGTCMRDAMKDPALKLYARIKQRNGSVFRTKSIRGFLENLIGKR